MKIFRFKIYKLIYKINGHTTPEDNTHNADEGTTKFVCRAEPSILRWNFTIFSMWILQNVELTHVEITYTHVPHSTKTIPSYCSCLNAKNYNTYSNCFF